MPPTKSQAPSRKKPFVYSDFEEAKGKILRAVPSGPFYALLTGASGTGKTSLLREVSASLDRHRYQVHYLAQSNASSAGLGRFLAETLHLTPRRSHTETLRAMAQALRTLPFRVLLFIDEAHLLAADALQEIRLLAESEIDSPPLFTVLFSGLPELREKLEAPALFPLKRRLLLRLELRGLKSDEVEGFLLNRLGEAARKLPAEALPSIFERARGVPALLEALAKACLEAAGDKDGLSPEILMEILESWDLV